MSASILPSVPPTIPSRANDQGGPSGIDVVDNSTPVKAKASEPHSRQEMLNDSWVKYTLIDERFLENHLQLPPSNAFDHDTQQKIDADVEEIRKFNKVDKVIYAPLASLLNTMSEALYDTLSNNEKETLRERHCVSCGSPGHLVFIDHHSTAPTQFPSRDRDCKVNDRPALLGVYTVADFEHDLDPKHIPGYEAHQIYKGVPYHRIEALVEIKPLDDRERATTYSYHHHQARPDRPGVYCLVAQPEWYQVIYSDPNGVVVSPQTAWDDSYLLAAYVYSHYFPPSGHFLWDDTIQWVTGTTISDMPNWKVKVQTQWYTQGELVFLGDPWALRTTILSASDGNGVQMIIKEMYREDHPFEEDIILEKIHGHGDILGAVRMQGRKGEEVQSGGKLIQCVRGNTQRTKVRFALLDSGVDLLQARSVNDLLKAIYDALEVHRTIYKKRRVLHRDMSFSNILMYPQWGQSNRLVSKKVPSFIEDILGGSKSTKSMFPACLVIDFDHAADLDAVGGSGSLKQRTGTPMFIARSVSLGRVLTNAGVFSGWEMPLLDGHALELYKAAHGQDRYARYNDVLTNEHKVGIKVKVGIKGKAWIKGIARTQGLRTKCMVGTQDTAKTKTFHGGFPPASEPRGTDLPAFAHRTEHDVESIYWTLVYTLLSVSPDDPHIPIETEPSSHSATVWNILLSHHVPAPNSSSMSERRSQILYLGPTDWRALFCDKMKDVALLLYKISQHVCPEYALWHWPSKQRPDHLHEAIQRLILQYLVDHREKGQEIPLKPSVMRPTRKRSTAAHVAVPMGFLPVKPVVEEESCRTKGTHIPSSSSLGRAPANGGIGAAAGSQKQPAAPVRTSSKRKSDQSDKPSDILRTSKRRKISKERDHLGLRVASSEGDAKHVVNVGASSAARDQAAIPVRTSSKRKSNDLGDNTVPEGLRRSKRRKATDDTGDGGDAGRRGGKERKSGSSAKRATNIRKDASCGDAANVRRGAPSAPTTELSVPSRTTRSKRKTADSDKSSEGVRSSQRLKEAVAKKEAAKKEAERKGGGNKEPAKRSVRGTRRT